MASLHHDSRRRSPFWYAAFTLSDGRRTFRSTKERARNRAWEIALKWEKAAALGRRGLLNEAQARKVLNDILESAGQGPMNLQSVDQFFANWLASKEVSKAKATARRYKDVIRPFLEQLTPQKRRGALSGIAPADVQLFRDSHLQAGLANKTANLSLKTLRNVFNAARRQGLILTNPAEAVETLPDNSTERGVFTLDELRALLREASPEWRGVILLGYSAGLRLGDAARLRWSEVELAEPVPVLRFYPQKTSGSGPKRRPLEIPILPDLEKYLQQLPVTSRNPDAPLFPGLARRKVGGRTGLSNTFTRLIAAAGINNPILSKGKGAKGRAVYRLSFHSLRHTFISIMANAGISKEMRMKLAGHTSSAHDRYTHLEIQTLRGALKSFPSLALDGQ
jgi:integrase